MIAPCEIGCRKYKKLSPKKSNVLRMQYSARVDENHAGMSLIYSLLAFRTPKPAASFIYPFENLSYNTSCVNLQKVSGKVHIFTYYGRGGIWSAGYFVSTVGLDEETIRNYVRYQDQEDLGQANLAFSQKPRT
jgi:putative transposase